LDLRIKNFQEKQFVSNVYEEWIAAQQQHSSNLQLGQSFGDGLSLHSPGKQLQSAHLI